MCVIALRHCLEARRNGRNPSLSLRPDTSIYFRDTAVRLSDLTSSMIEHSKSRMSYGPLTTTGFLDFSPSEARASGFPLDWKGPPRHPPIDIDALFDAKIGGTGRLDANSQCIQYMQNHFDIWKRVPPREVPCHHEKSLSSDGGLEKGHGSSAKRALNKVARTFARTHQLPAPWQRFMDELSIEQTLSQHRYG